MDQYFSQYKKAAEVHKEIDASDLKQVPTEELIKLAQRANLCIREGLGVAHIIEPFSVIVEGTIRSKLSQEHFSLLTSPIKKPFILSYDETLYNLSKERDKDKRKKLIDSIKKDFYWIKNSYAQKVELTEELILTESRDIGKINTTNYQQRTEEKAKLMKKLNLSPELVHLIHITEKFAYLQDERKKNSLIAIDYFCKVANELVTRTPLTAEEFYFLLPSELNTEHLNQDFKEELQKRAKSFTLVNLQGEIYSTTKKVSLEKDKENINAVNGTPASLGKVIGKARICKNISQIGKVEQGDILIVPMTRPEYVPAMKKAIAIVTDEGGLTCHAAVIARELGKPCVIGTRIATKVFKDNDMLEVNANHGIVRKLE
ncbi:hypothetical protein COY27_01015 [Candidatus Woesearchaeota archaeon CG_4_10_14_0_2_um_filter_33_13]|nr:MAG: hypothetical protein COY27_01015 [Candidatus Woesearchaeota archaeon CG_4_10_14_0_2_um_filter_33_13]